MEGYEELQRRKRKGLTLCQQKAGIDNKLSHIGDFQSPKAISPNRSLQLLDMSLRFVRFSP